MNYLNGQSKFSWWLFARYSMTCGQEMKWSVQWISLKIAGTFGDCWYLCWFVIIHWQLKAKGQTKNNCRWPLLHHHGIILQIQPFLRSGISLYWFCFPFYRTFSIIMDAWSYEGREVCFKSLCCHKVNVRNSRLKSNYI